MVERILRWLAPALALAAAIFLPAVSVIAPFTTTQRWTILQLAHPDGHSSFGSLLATARQLATAVQAGAGLDRALRLAGAIPLMAIVSGLCALAALLLQFWPRGRGLPAFGVAAVGVACSGYALAGCWLLSRAAHAALESGLARLHSRVEVSDWNAVAQQFRLQTELRAEPALYIVCLALVVLLILPLPRTPKM